MLLKVKPFYTEYNAINIFNTAIMRYKKNIDLNNATKNGWKSSPIFSLIIDIPQCCW